MPPVQLNNLKNENLLIQKIFNSELNDLIKIADDWDEDSEEKYGGCDEEKRTALHAAAFIGDSETTEVVLSVLNDPDIVNAKDAQWLTPLHRACRSGAEGIVSQLLKAEAEVHHRDRNWQTPVHVAAANNTVACMELLLPEVDDINIADRAGRTALHLAAYFGHADMVQLLLKSEANVNKKDKRDRRPLHWAAFRGHQGVVKMLLDAEADIMAVDKDGYTPLHSACASGAEMSVVMLLQFAANYGDIEKTELLNAVNNAGNTPIHTACINGHEQILEVFLNDPDLNFNEFVILGNKRGETPLHLSAASTHGERCLELLISKTDNLTPKDFEVTTNEGRTAMHYAAKHGRLSRVQTLISVSNENVRDIKGQTPLHLAAKFGHEHVIELILRNSPRALVDPLSLLYEVDNDGRNPLHLAAHSSNVGVCRKLITAVTNASSSTGSSMDSKRQIEKFINSRDNYDMTCLHLCANKECAETLEFLLTSCDANPNVKDAYGRSPLHYSADKSWLQCVHYLVMNGCDINVVDSDLVTPLMLCSSEDSEAKCLEYLITQNADLFAADKRGFNSFHYAAAAGNSDALMGMFEDQKATAQVLQRVSTTAQARKYLQQERSMKQKHNKKSFLTPSSSPDNNASSNNNNLKRLPPTTPLHIAARNDHADCVKVLTAVMKVDCLDAFGSTPLHSAAESGSVYAVEALLDKYASDSEKNCVADYVSIRDERSKSTPLHLAAAGAKFELVKLLTSKIEQGDDLFNLKDAKGRTPLIIASQNGRVNTIEFLIEQGANVNDFDKFGRTALFYATFFGHETSVDILIESGADASKKDSKGRTVVHVASAMGRAVILSDLFHTICDKKRTKKNSQTAEDICAAVLSEKDIFGMTALHLATLRGHIGCVTFLAQALKASSGKNDDVVSWKSVFPSISDKISPLHCAVFNKSDQCISVLLKQFPSEAVNKPDLLQRAPLHVAAQVDSLNCVKRLIAAGADVNKKDKFNSTPLMIAIKAKSEEIVKYLLNGSSQNQQNGHSSVENGVVNGGTSANYDDDIDVNEVFFDEKCLLDEVDDDGNTALHHACIAGVDEIAVALLKSPAGSELVDKQNNKGESPLHIAAGTGLLETTKTLLKAGASVTLADKRGYFPLLSCASSPEVANCMAEILGVFLDFAGMTSGEISTRKSSIGSFRLSDVSGGVRSSILSAVSETDVSTASTAKTVNDNTFTISDNACNNNNNNEEASSNA